MATKTDINRLRKSMSDRQIFDHMRREDPTFDAAVGRVQTANPNMRGLMQATFPTAILNRHYFGSWILPENVANDANETIQQTSDLIDRADESWRQRIQRDIVERGERFGGALERVRAGEQAFPSTALQLTGETVGGAYDVLGETLISGFRSLPDFIEDPIREGVSTAGQFFSETKAGQSVLQAISQGAQVFEDLKKTNPEAAENLRALSNIASALPLAKGVSLVTSRTVTRVSPTLQRSLQKKITRDSIVITKPKLSVAEKAEALLELRGEGKIALKLKPSTEDFAIAKSVEDIVQPGLRNRIDNISRIDKKISKVGASVDSVLERNPITFTDGELRVFLNAKKEESKLLFAGEASKEKAYDAVIDDFFSVLKEEITEGKMKKTGKNNIGNAIKSRQVQDKRRRILLRGDPDQNIKKTAFRDIRSGLNEFAEKKLETAKSIDLDGKIPVSGFVERGGELVAVNEMSLRDAFRFQRRMFQAQGNIANQLARFVDISLTKKIITLMRENPITSFATGGILTFGAITGLLTNPIVLGSLLIGGTVKLGAKIITSRKLKRSLVRMADMMSKSGDVVDVSVIRELIESFEE